MKAISGIEMLLIGAIGTVTIISAGVMPSATVKLTEDKNLIFEYNYNKVQLFLLNLLSTTSDNKKVYESVAEHIAINKPDNLDFLKGKFDNLLEKKCYQLATQTSVLLQAVSCQPVYFVNTTIVLPYNPNKLVETIKVGIG